MIIGISIIAGLVTGISISLIFIVDQLEKLNENVKNLKRKNNSKG